MHIFLKWPFGYQNTPSKSPKQQRAYVFNNIIGIL